MRKKYITGGCVLAIVALIIAIYLSVGREEDRGVVGVADYKNATYVLDGSPVTLTDGYAESQAAPGSAAKIITRYFGNEVRHDLDDDGREDVAFLLTQETGGSGTFFYAVAALNTADGYVGSDGFLLGDRIAPQSTHMDEGMTVQGTQRKNVIVVNYAVRRPGEPMTASPSVGKSVWLKLDPATMQLGEVAQNFEGESRYMDIQTYVRTSISELSPVKATMGGTFFVTQIETGGGKGVVEYEDGHNAYVADFAYAIAEDGRPSVYSFVVR